MKFERMQQLFVYGSLCFPEIVEKLTGNIFETEPAVLHGFLRQKVKGCDYPAITKKEGEKVEGFLLKNLNERAVQILTFFEGDEYQKEIVDVETEIGREKALVFVWKNSPDLLEKGDWSFQTFKKESLPVYLEKIIPQTLEEYEKNCQTF